jgi:hypothetical protein
VNLGVDYSFLYRVVEIAVDATARFPALLQLDRRPKVNLADDAHLGTLGNRTI